MDNPGEIMRLCRLCLVKDQVNIPIFDEQGDIRQIFLKISSCLPVKVSKEDQLPKSICDGCSNKLDLLYEFRNSSVNAEKALLSWVSQAIKDVDETVGVATQPVAKPSETQVKEETLEECHAPLVHSNDSMDAQESAAFDENSAKEESDEPPPPKRARRTAAVKAQINIAPDSDDEDDDDLDIDAEPLTKIEDESDESDGDEKDDPSYPDVPGTSADDQPGPSGVGKDGVEAPSFDTSILNNLIYGPGISITPIKQERLEYPSVTTSSFPTNFYNYNNYETFNNATLFNGLNSAAFGKVLDSEIDLVEAKEELIDEPGILACFKSEKISSLVKVKKEPNILECLLKNKGNKKNRKRRTPVEHPPPVDLDEPIQCDVCNNTYKNNVAFAIHSIFHANDNRYYCHLCDYKNGSKYHIEMHVRAHEGTTKYKCEICGKAFTISTHAVEHKYYHTGEKPFQCEICGKHFMFSWFLTSHRRTQHWEIVTGSPLVKYDCTICKKHYTSSTGLKRHNMNHHDSPGADNSVLCDICGKSLSSKEKLKFHRRIHTGYKPYSCEICSKSFSRKEQLKEHERVHTGEKPYICKFCGKGFTQRSPLRIHERTHTGERPYKCIICQKGFISKGVMDTHMKSCSV